MNYAGKIAIRNILKVIALLISLILFEYFAVKYTLNDIRAGKWNAVFMGQAITFFLGMGMGVLVIKMDTWFNSFIDSAINRIKNARFGDKGEKQVYEEVKKLLRMNIKMIHERK